jgi:drug/metabolite transporter (DMT)-like permease
VGVATGVQALALWLGWGTPTALLMAHPGWERFVAVSLFTGLGCAWLATVLWNEASRRLPASLAGQLIVSETLFALLYAATLQGQWPSVTALAACGLFLAGILATLGAHP